MTSDELCTDRELIVNSHAVQSSREGRDFGNVTGLLGASGRPSTPTEALGKVQASLNDAVRRGWGLPQDGFGDD